MVAQTACDGLFCNEAYITGVIVLGVVVLGLIGFVVFRILPVNAARRSDGLPPLRWLEIGGSRMRPADLASASSELLAVEREHQRQMDWEKEQATHEMIRTGQHVTRQFCSPHQRWCFHSFEDGHPPGGFDNPKVPDDWPPDLRKAPRG